MTLEQQLFNAAEHGNLEAIRELIKSGADPRVDGCYALDLAIDGNHLEAALLLKEEINKKGAQ